MNTTRGLRSVLRPLRRRAREARRALQGVVARSMARPVVLLFHRVMPPGLDPQLLAVRPAVFEAQLAMLATRYEVLPLAQLLEEARQGRYGRRRVAISFDDGYCDNFRIAAPILRRYALPATIFAVGAPLVSGHEFWWDDVERVLLSAATLPETFHFEGSENAVSFSLGAERKWMQGEAARFLGWNVTQEAPTRRHMMYLRLMEIGRQAPVDYRNQLVAALRSWAELPAGARRDHGSMTVDEIRAVAAEGLIAIGAHTMNHPMLSALSAAQQREEIVQSKALIERLTGQTAAGFAYPYGERSHFTAETAQCVHDAGLPWACANVPGVVDADCRFLEVPRLLVRDCPPEALADMIDRRIY